MNARPIRISSRDNPLIARIRRLQSQPGAYRRVGSVWLEGEHLLSAAKARGVIPEIALLPAARENDSALFELAGSASRMAVVDDGLWREMAGLESPATIGALMAWPQPAPIDPNCPTVVLDRIQDPGNAGSILRSAAALDIVQVIALEGTAGLWSPRVLRAAMGAHFALKLVESARPADLDGLEVPLLATGSHARSSLPAADLPQIAAWVFGHEGGGIAPEIESRCAMTVAIPQPGGEESLNVAAAAAICLYESVRRRAAPNTGRSP